MVFVVSFKAKDPSLIPTATVAVTVLVAPLIAARVDWLKLPATGEYITYITFLTVSTSM